MSTVSRTSEDSLLSDKEYLDSGSLPFPYPAKAFGKRKRALFATATLVSLLFLTSYLTLQYRASDWFGNDLKPIPFAPEPVEDVEYPLNATYPPSYVGVRGPPTPLFRGAQPPWPPLSELSTYRIQIICYPMHSTSPHGLLLDGVRPVVFPTLCPVLTVVFVPLRSYVIFSERCDGLRKSTSVDVDGLNPTSVLKYLNQGNLIYLALITDRIPVLPKFTPSHVLVEGRVGDLPFGEIFDVPLLSLLLKTPVLEWRDVKIDEPYVTETMGCWAVWAAQQSYEPGPREGWFPRNAGLGGFLLLFSSPIHYSSVFV